jgi:hypothetical protein
LEELISAIERLQAVMIEDLTKQVVELEQQVWEQLALWHERKVTQ